jgi:hypothetical protein
MTLLERAEEYARLLSVGSEILDDTDGPVVAPFRHLLAAVLYRRRLFLERTAQGQIVTDRPPWFIAGGLMAQRHQPITCTDCKRSWFSCEHGDKAGVAVQPAQDDIIWPLQRSPRERAVA